ncbi:LNS2-domain-containing protein [Phellopilus nigrolimitatus]|nr:LNS2-domain-containing protein [Phellopilus nigrolimitatus]
MNYLRGALSAASQYYRDINPSTLTGAIDVIVVRRTTEGGEEELACSPFHVRFGKWQVLRPVDKKVKVLVNGQEIPFNMKIGDAGEAFFVFETDGDVPDELITSPLLEATQPGQSNVDVTAGRFGAREEAGGEEPDSMSPEKPLGEPEPLDLNSPSESANESPQPSGLSLSRPTSNLPTSMPSLSSSPGQSSSNAEVLKPSNIVGGAAHLGKAIVRAAVETERDKQLRMHDKVAAARNITDHAYDGMSDQLARMTDRKEADEKGDEALPDVEKGEGEPPTIAYTQDVVLDNTGYHSKNARSENVMKDTKRKLSRSNLRRTINEEPDEYDSFEGPSTPRSGDPSGQVTPTQTPDTSRSPSPNGRYGSVSPKHHRSHTTPTFRASSEPPDTSSDNSPPAYSWEWGAFPTPSPMKTSFSPSREGFERSISVPHQLESVDMRPPTPTRSKTQESYPSPPSSPMSSSGAQFYDEGADLTADENNGRRFLVTLGGRTYEFELSITEDLSGGEDEIQDAKRFREGQVSFRRFMKYPAVVRDGNLVMRWNDRYVTRGDQSPLMDYLVKWREAALAKPTNARALEEEEPLSSSDEREPSAERVAPKKTSSSWVRWWRSSRTEQQEAQTARTSSRDENGSRRPELAPSNSAPPSAEARSSTPVPFPTMITTAKDYSSDDETHDRKRFAKTLRLTSDQLKQLDLKAGLNSITFSLSASGVTACTASIFLWESTDSVVVSDIDGTITKSDALGHVFTMIGRDWTHIGVAKLYTDICRNGYRIMYLTSRAIGQADSTRYYLKGINQNNYQLPEGPVVMSPDRLMASFHREVIMRKPEVFKMACLRDIQRLFGEGNNPFYAGFGNRITDALSYRSVNIPSQRIFTIDSSGEVKMELLEVAGYKSSYIHLTDLVDQMFPPVHQRGAPEFTDFNYWKTPVQEFPLPDLSPPSPALSAHSDVSNQGTFSRIRNFSLGRQNGRSFVLPPPATQAGEGGSGLRQITSLERLSNRHTRSSETLESTLVDTEDDRDLERRARKRLSMDSMPGSLPGSAGSQADSDEEEEVGGEENYEGEVEDPEEAAEEGFDEDFLATGEMESVPFL